MRWTFDDGMAHKWLTEGVPDRKFPDSTMEPIPAMRLITEELVLDGIPERNLATFVTTWMEPEAQRIIAENLHRNFIDHAEYPQTAEIEQRCIRMLADLFNAPGETTGARTQGSSEAIMLGALSLKWKWRERREAAGKDTEQARTSSSAATCTWSGRSSAATSTSSRGSCRCNPTSTRSARRTSSRTSTRTRSASPRSSAPRSPATPTTSSASTTCLVKLPRRAGARRAAAHRRRQRRLRLAVPLPGLEVGLPPRAGALDQRLRPQVRARLPRDRLADLPRAVRPGRGPRLLRELPRQDRRDVHAQLLDRVGDGAGPVLRADPLRTPRVRVRDGGDAEERRVPRRADPGGRPVPGDRRRRRAAAAGRLPARRGDSPTTSSTSPGRWPRSAAGCCPPTRCRPTPTT